MNEAVKMWGRYKSLQKRMNGGFSLMQCSRCGESVYKGDNYCRRCGAKFVDKEKEHK